MILTPMLCASGSKTRTLTVHTLARALLEAEKILGPDRVWDGVNDVQKEYLAKYFLRNEAASIEDLRAWVSKSADELNAILAKNGFDIQLDAFGSDEFGVVAILDMLAFWLKKGKPVSVRQIFPGVLLKTGVDVYHSSSTHPNPIVSIETKSREGSGGRVVFYMSVLDEAPDGFDLIRKVEEIERFERGADFSGVIFPMIDLDLKASMEWLLGMQTRDSDGAPWYISQALQQTKFRMDENGARIQDAVAVAVKRMCMGPGPYVIDKPFLLWVRVDGLSLPLFVSYLDMDCWKKPRDIREM